MSIIGSSIRTDISGVITGIDKKKLLISFQYGGIISVPMNKYEDMLYVSEETKEEIRQYLEDLKNQNKK